MADAETQTAPPKPKPVWLLNVIKWMRRFVFVAGAVLIWIIVGKVGILGDSVFQSGSMIISAFLFAFALPLSIVFRLDELFVKYGVSDLSAALGIALVYVAANFALIGALAGGWKQMRGKKGKEEENENAGPDRTKLNGAGDSTKH